MKTYIGLFEYEQGKQGFSVVFPDFPGLITAGDSYEEALQMAHDALSGHLEFLQEEGEEIPKPSPIELIQETWEDWDEWKNNYSFLVVPVAVFLKNKKVKTIQIELEETLIEKIDMISSNRSEFINKALETTLSL